VADTVDQQAPTAEIGAFRAALSNVCTPVTVVTAFAGTRAHGTTVSAFASLSLDPPMVMVALATTSDLLALVEVGGPFGVNVLASDQAHLAIRFATKGKDKFDGVDVVDDHGSPRLPGAGTWLGCEVADLVPGGDHVIVLGTVVTADTLPSTPLTYHARTFGLHMKHPPASSPSTRS